MPVIVLFLLVLLFSPSVSQAQAGAAPGSAAFSSPFDPSAIETFMDSLITPRIESGDIPGAMVVVVEDGRILFNKGYGYRNLEAKRPVRPDSTLFYIASLTKTFTATAVMQLVEQGRLDLHADVNRYLTAFQIPATYAEPVTLAHLLTHTVGFDDKNIGYAARTEEEAIPLERYLETDMPPRVMPPGSISSYSNHGYGLAGYLVERAYGMDYADYIERYILHPLGMMRSTAHLPPPPALIDHLAQGYAYDYSAGRFVPQPLGYRKLPPAGTICVTGADMAKFMIAHLQDGRYGDIRILSEDTARQMRRQQFTHHPRLPGVAFGFFESFRGRIRTLEHAGGYFGFSAYMALAPDEKFGVFVAINKTAGGSSQIAHALLDRYYPVSKSSPPAASPALSINLKRFTGTYHWTRYSRRSVEKIAIWDFPMFVSTDGGQLFLRPVQGKPIVWRPIEPDLFQRVDREEYMAYREENGRITHLFLSQDGSLPIALEKLAWYDDVEVNRPAALIMMGILFSTFTLWPATAGIAWVIRRWRKMPRPSRAFRLPVLLAVLVGLIDFAFFVGLDGWMGNSGYRLKLIYGMTPEMVGLLWLPLISLPLTALAAYRAIRIWRQGVWTVAGRVYYSLVAFSAVVFVVFLYHWHLLGFVY